MKKAFTLIELVVAVTLLAMVISFSSVIFRVSIDSHRTAAANAEVMQKLRAITEQLNADFKGLQKDAPLLIWFDQQESDKGDSRLDQIMFFTVGDFQSAQLYSTGNNQYPEDEYDEDYGYVRGNAARVYYGLAKSRDPNNPSKQDLTKPHELTPRHRILARRQHILTSDSKLDQWLDVGSSGNLSGFSGMQEGYKKNELYEHDSLSLAQWKAVDNTEYVDVTDNAFYDRLNADGYPEVDTQDPRTFHKLFCEGVASFAVQWYYEDTKGVSDENRWFPSSDPDNDGDDDDNDSDFEVDPYFGVFFNIPGSSLSLPIDWKSVRESGDFSGFDSDKEDIVPNNTNKGFFPEALKFTFRICDSMNIIKETDSDGELIDGRTFTHIVYLKD